MKELFHTNALLFNSTPDAQTSNNFITKYFLLTTEYNLHGWCLNELD